jgi:hypothetical protein
VQAIEFAGLSDALDDLLSVLDLAIGQKKYLPWHILLLGLRENRK